MNPEEIELDLSGVEITSPTPADAARNLTISTAENLGAAAFIPNQELVQLFDDPHELSRVYDLLIKTMRKMGYINEQRTLSLGNCILLGGFGSDVEMTNGSVIRFRLSSIGMMAFAWELDEIHQVEGVPEAHSKAMEWRRRAHLVSNIEYAMIPLLPS